MNRNLWLVLLSIAALAITGPLDGLGQDSTAKKYLIIHADDAGMSHSVNAATVDGMEKGIVSSASIMIPCPWVVEFAKYCREHPDGDYGVHLTLNCEWDDYRWGPVAPREQVPSLVDPDGYLWDNVGQVVQHAKADEVLIELRAQVKRAQQLGIPLSHLDTHMGAVVARPDLLEVYVQLAIEFGLPVLYTKESPPNRQYPEMQKLRDTLRQQLEAQGLPVLDRLAQYYSGDGLQLRRETYVNFLRTLEPGVTQLIIHCGYDNEELRSITSSSGRRDADRVVFSDPKVAELVRDLGIEVISWKQFVAMNSK